MEKIGAWQNYMDERNVALIVFGEIVKKKPFLFIKYDDIFSKMQIKTSSLFSFAGKLSHDVAGGEHSI